MWKLALLSVLILPLGCGPARTGSLWQDPTPTVSDDDDDDTDDDDVTDDDDDIPDGFDEDGDGSYFFPRDRLLEIEIELSDASWESLELFPYGYTEATVHIDGRLINDVAVRLRGRIGSFREVDDKPKWRLDFNRLVEGRRIEGLEALSLDNNVVDCSGMKQALATHVLGLAGALGSRAGFATVAVNGRNYGVYNTIEVQDDRYLKSRFADGTGRLYDGAYAWFGEWDVRFADFTSWNLEWYQLEEGEDVGRADLQAVIDALAAAPSGDFVSTMGAVWDMQALYRYAAAEYWIGQNDGYFLNRNNNRVYFDPTTGRGTFITYDLDYAFLWEPWGATWDAPAGALAEACFDDAECLAGVKSAASALLESLDTTALLADFDAWDTVTWQAASTDPRDSCSGNAVGNGRDFLREWVRTRGDAMRAQWDLP